MHIVPFDIDKHRGMLSGSAVRRYMCHVLQVLYLNVSIYVKEKKKKRRTLRWLFVIAVARGELTPGNNSRRDNRRIF